MIDRETDRKLSKLKRLFDAAPTHERLKMGGKIDRIACQLDARHEPIPRRLQRIQKDFELDVFDDMFDNMPV